MAALVLTALDLRTAGETDELAVPFTRDACATLADTPAGVAVQRIVDQDDDELRAAYLDLLRPSLRTNASTALQVALDDLRLALDQERWSDAMRIAAEVDRRVTADCPPA